MPPVWRAGDAAAAWRDLARRELARRGRTRRPRGAGHLSGPASGPLSGPATPTAALARGIGRGGLLALTINSVVGAAVYGLPAAVAGLVGPWSVPAVGASALVIGLVACCFVEVASRYDGTGGPYLYARDAFGPAAGFATGWLLLVARLAGGAALCGLFAEYLTPFVPAAGAGAGRLAAIVGVLALLAAVHARGVRVAAAVGSAVTVAKLLPLVALVAVGAMAVVPSRLALGPVPPVPTFGRAVLLLCFAFSGFETVVIAAGESRDPRRDVPVALGAGLAGVAVLYAAVQAVCVGAVPGLAGAQRPLAEAARALAGDAAAPAVALGALVAIGGTLHTALLAASRLAYAMADAGDLPRPLAHVHPHYRTPVVALAGAAATFAGLAAVSSFRGALTVSTAARLLVYGATCAALPVLRRRPDAPPARVRLPAAGVAWIGGLGLVAAVLAGVSAVQAATLTGALAVGVAVRGLALRARRTATPVPR